MVWDVIRDLGIFTIGAGILGLLGRYAIKQYFEKELSKYQQELEKEKVRFSELHTKRAEVTVELYQRFVRFEEAMRAMTDPMQRHGDKPKDEKIDDAAKSGNEFINYYMENKIYFPPHVCETIEELHQESKSIFNEFRIYKPYESNYHQTADTDQWLELWERVTEDDVPEVKEDLEIHFRDLLGVDEEQSISQYTNQK